MTAYPITSLKLFMIMLRMSSMPAFMSWIVLVERLYQFESAQRTLTRGVGCSLTVFFLRFI